MKVAGGEFHGVRIGDLMATAGMVHPQCRIVHNLLFLLRSGRHSSVHAMAVARGLT